MNYLALAVGHCKLYHAAVLADLMPRRDHRRAAQPLLNGSQQLECLHAYRVRQTALNSLRILRALVSDRVPRRSFLYMPRLDKVGKAVRIVEVVYPAVTLAQLAQRFRLDLSGQAAQDKEDQDLDIQLFMYESKTCHNRLLP